MGATPKKWLAALAASACVLALPWPSAAYDRPGVVERVSTGTDGRQLALGAGDRHSITPDGRFVAYVAEERKLGTTTIGDVYVLDRRTGKVAIASVTSDGSPGIGAPTCPGASTPAISDNGRYVAFATCYNNFPGGVGGIYVHDMKTGMNTLVTVSADGKTPSTGTFLYPTISADGRYVAYETSTLDIVSMPCVPAPVPVQCPFAYQVYVRDTRGKGSTELVSATPSGGWPDGNSYRPSISADGRYVEFTSTASDLTGGDHNICTADVTSPTSCQDVYLRDRKNKTTELISVGLDGQAAATQFLGSSSDWVQGISRDDRYVGFESSAGNLVPNAPSGGFFVRDRKTGRTVNVGVDSYGRPVHSPVQFSVSPDGRYFAGASVTIACDPTLPAPGVVTFYDVVTGAMQVLGRTDYHGQTVKCSDYYNAYAPEIATGGRLVTFDTNGSHLVAGDSNNAGDVFLQDRGSPLGIGGLVRAGKLAIADRPNFVAAGAIFAADASADIAAPLVTDGADLVGATLAYRPELADLFVRLSVARMPSFPLADPALTYGFDFTVGRTPYEVRIAKTGLTASFELYRRTPTSWTYAGELRGAYGTTGQEVVVAVPLADVGAQHGALIQHVRAFTAIGVLGAVDELNL